MIEIKVQNIVASTTFAEKLDLVVIAQSLENTEDVSTVVEKVSKKLTSMGLLH